jgi:Na+/melibiose symporter-like transporter
MGDRRAGEEHTQSNARAKPMAVPHGRPPGDSAQRVHSASRRVGHWPRPALDPVPTHLLRRCGQRRARARGSRAGTTRYDLPGALLSTAGLVSLVYGFTKAESHGWRSGPTLLFLSVAVILLAAFVIVESRSSHPLLPLRVVAERNRGGAFLANLLTGAGLFAMFVFLSYYLQGVLRYSALRAGIAFLPFAGGLVVAAAASTALVPRVGPRIPMTLGLLTAAGGSAG